MVLISEVKVVGVPRVVQEYNVPSKTGAVIEGALKDAGWPVINGEQFEVIRERQLDYARLDQADERLIARRHCPQHFRYLECLDVARTLMRAG